MAHAEALFPILAQPALYRYIDEEPPASVEALRHKLSRSESRLSPDGLEHWLNWVIWVEHGASPSIAGYVQATVTVSSLDANVAYVIGSAYEGRGIASEAVAQMIFIVAKDFGVTRLYIQADRDNQRSVRLAERLGFVEASPALAAQRGLDASEVLWLKVLS